MCLSIVYDKEKQAKIIKKTTKKGGWITVWKRVTSTMLGEYYPFQFKKGLNVSPRQRAIRANDMELYVPCFHVWRYKKHADCNCSYLRTVKCKIRPSWITAVGSQGYWNQRDAFVSKKIIIHP